MTMPSWGSRAKDGPIHTAAAAEPQAADPNERRDTTWFDSSWELRQGLVVAELTDTDDLPAEWRGAVAR
jgi:hypothetical protein